MKKLIICGACLCIACCSAQASVENYNRPNGLDDLGDNVINRVKDIIKDTDKDRVITGMDKKQYDLAKAPKSKRPSSDWVRWGNAHNLVEELRALLDSSKVAVRDGEHASNKLLNQRWEQIVEKLRKAHSIVRNFPSSPETDYLLRKILDTADLLEKRHDRIESLGKTVKDSPDYLERKKDLDSMLEYSQAMEWPIDNYLVQEMTRYADRIDACLETERIRRSEPRETPFGLKSGAPPDDSESAKGTETETLGADTPQGDRGIGDSLEDLE